MIKINGKIIKTAHGSIKTPVFLPDATRGYIKALSNEDLKIVGVKSMVVNTYHLYLQPGIKVIKKATHLRNASARQGGIHKFMNWDGPLVSDSGGYQVFSLIYKNSKMGKIFDDKVIFKSPLDGSKHEFTPEKSIQIQFDLGVDMMVCLDDCPPNNSDERLLKLSVDRTIDWAKRCRREWEKQIKKRRLKGSNKPKLIAVIQGGINFDLRKYCSEKLIKIGFEGYGFGGRHVDSEGKLLADMLQLTADLIPDDAIRFALGIGTPEDIAICARMGWDMFDCVIPTREGRHGRLYTSPPTPLLIRRGELKGRGVYKTYNISNSKFKNDFSAINKDSKIPELRDYSKAYLHHLFKMNESLGLRLASMNNLELYNDLMKLLKK